MFLENFQDWVASGWTRKIGSQHDAMRELAIMCMGLPGEVGEVLEIIKKETRGDGPANIQALKLELGDVLHYLCRIASTYDISMGDVMKANIEKIEAKRGKRPWEVK